MDCKVLLCCVVFTAFVGLVTPCLDCDCLQVQQRPVRMPILPLRQTIQATIPPFTSYLRWLRNQRNKFFRTLDNYEDDIQNNAAQVATAAQPAAGCPYSYERPKTCNCVVRLPPIPIPQLPQVLPAPCGCQSCQTSTTPEPTNQCNEIEKSFESDSESESESIEDDDSDIICAQCGGKKVCAACSRAQANFEDDSSSSSSSSSSSEEDDSRSKSSSSRYSKKYDSSSRSRNRKSSKKYNSSRSSSSEENDSSNSSSSSSSSKKDDSSSGSGSSEGDDVSNTTTDDTNEDDDIIGGEDDDDGNDDKDDDNSAPKNRKTKSKTYSKDCKAEKNKLSRICRICNSS